MGSVSLSRQRSVLSQVLFAVCVAAFSRLAASAPGLPGHSRAPEADGVQGLKNQASCCIAVHFELHFINKPSFHLRGYRSSSLLPCGMFFGWMCEPIRFFLWL